ncbi:MAG: D-alanyl-D-alanine carboxypeptidase/D-alanyl-D-alanine-endopeptidase [Pseudomonadota bacterium]
MARNITRRRALGGLVAGIGTAASSGELPSSPWPRARPERAAEPERQAAEGDRRALEMVDAAGLSGTVSFAVYDTETRIPVARHLGAFPTAPASTAKAVTAIYALDRLGGDYRFGTRLVATGPVEAGILRGDLVLAGTGDPVFDSDDLAALVEGLKRAGITGIDGKFLIWDGHLPRVDRIVYGQPDIASYNPTISGMNLNFNRVHFEWKREKSDYNITLQARARQFRPAVRIATMDIVEERLPVFTYTAEKGLDRWTVARNALGKGGARWLPVRRPLEYVGEAFQAIARFEGIDVPRAARAEAAPEGRVLAEHLSLPLERMLFGMLKFSTNLTAEVVGLHASAAVGAMPVSLLGSAAAMNRWAAARFGVDGVRFVDHSGLGYGSRIGADHMAAILAGAAAEDRLRPLLKPVALGADAGKVEVLAKTGTHNFVSALAGYLDAPGGRRLAFGVFCADPERRDAVPIARRERPTGARTYGRVARRLQKDLLRHWARSYAV